MLGEPNPLDICLAVIIVAAEALGKGGCAVRARRVLDDRDKLIEEVGIG